MILIIKIRLTSPLLGELAKDAMGVRRFRRDRDDVVVCVPEWQRSYREAARLLGLDVCTDGMMPKSKYRLASVHLYRRIWSGVNVEYFESMRKGTILTMEMVFDEAVRRSPNPTQLKAILGHVGEHIGISQFGSKFGFGRFDVVSIEIKDIDGDSDGGAVHGKEGGRGWGAAAAREGSRDGQREDVQRDPARGDGGQAL